MTGAEAIALTSLHQMGNYARFPVTFVRGEGSWLFDDTGKPYLDFLGGIAVAVLGHATKLVSALIKSYNDKYDLLLNAELIRSIRRMQEKIRNNFSLATIVQGVGVQSWAAR